MRVAIITTVRHNIGDDFVRDGILYLLGKVIGDFTPLMIHKHFPVSVRQEWDWLHRTGVTSVCDRLPGFRAIAWSNFIDRLPLKEKSDKILSSDLVVQSGAPVYWLNDASDCSRNEWYEPLIKRRWDRSGSKVPLVNIGAGSCQAYGSDGSEFLANEKVLRYIREFFTFSSLTTVRDQLSSVILRHAGMQAPVLPCPAVFARRKHLINDGAREYVALNYMDSGGHFNLGSPINGEAWRSTFSEVARRLAKHYRCVVICHTKAERRRVRQIVPELESFYSENYIDYLRMYSKAYFGVVNRVHAAMAMAGFGRPCLVIGNDSRAQMASLLGMPSLDVREASVERIFGEIAWLGSNLDEFNRRVCHVLQDAEAEYLRLLRWSLGRAGG